MEDCIHLCFLECPNLPMSCMCSAHDSHGPHGLNSDPMIDPIKLLHPSELLSEANRKQWQWEKCFFIASETPIVQNIWLENHLICYGTQWETS